MNARRPLAAAALAFTLLAAHAGQRCDATPPTVDEVARGMALAQATAARLDASGAQVVVLARAGQDLGRYGIAWSHLGFAYREAATDGRPRWRVLHKLNACGTARGEVWRQGLGEFFLDRPYRYEAAFVVPAPEVQARLAPLLADNRRAARWHAPAYSLVAYPWSQRYQQSNQWAIETLAGALDDDAAGRARAQAWLQLRGYTPQVLRLGPLERLGARATAANVAFDDHPGADRFADRIATVTADSVFAWLQRAGLAGAVERVR